MGERLWVWVGGGSAHDYAQEYLKEQGEKKGGPGLDEDAEGLGGLGAGQEHRRAN